MRIVSYNKLYLKKKTCFVGFFVCVRQLEEDEDKPRLDDEWDGINFMVDNETGK